MLAGPAGNAKEGPADGKAGDTGYGFPGKSDFSPWWLGEQQSPGIDFYPGVSFTDPVQGIKEQGQNQ